MCSLSIIEKPLIKLITSSSGKCSNNGNPGTSHCLHEIFIQVRKSQYGQNMVKQTGSKLAKECSPLIYSICIILWEAGLEEVKSGFKIDGWNINNPCYASNTVLIAKNAKKLQAPILHSLSKAHSWCFQQFLFPFRGYFPNEICSFRKKKRRRKGEEGKAL